MADEVLGSLAVEITGDYSELESSISSAVGAAETGAEKIADAFNITDMGSEMAAGLGTLVDQIVAAGDAAASAGGQMSIFGSEATTALEDVNAQMALFDTNGIEAADSAFGSLAVAAGDAVSPTQEVGAALVQTGGDAQDAEGGLKGMVEQLTLLGEALAITEGLKEFGQEALTAYGTVQSVTIGLTALTGSAEKADEIITQVKELAATEPFAFPEIAPTVQKMIALGVAAEQIPTVMQAVADSSAATGNSFNAVANSFDRLSLSGTTSARALVQLGIGTKDLAEAMGVADGEVKNAFKDLDQSERIDVLSAAMQKFAGTAEAEAQGIAGQWQIFKNQFEEVMVGVGSALAPVIGQILSFGKAVLEGLKIATDGFAALPGPVQDVIVVIGLAVAAVVPLTAGLVALGLAIVGLQSLPAIFTALTTAIGITSEAEGTLAVSAGTATAALAAEGTTAVTTAGEMDTAAAAAGGFTGILSTLGTTLGVVGALFAGWSLGVWAADVKDASAQLQDMDKYAKSLGVNLDQAGASGDGLAHAVTRLEAIAAQDNITIERGTKTLQEYALALLQAIQQDDAMAAATGQQKDAVDSTQAAYAALITKTSDLRISYQQAQAVLAQVNAAMRDAQGDSARLTLLQDAHAKAVADVDAAYKALAPGLKTQKDSIEAVTKATQALVDNEKAASDAWLAAKQAYVDGTGTLAALGIATENLGKADAAYKTAIDAATGSTVAHSQAAKELANSIQGIHDAQAKADATLQTAIGTYNNIRQAANDGAVSTAEWTRAENDLIAAWTAANPAEHGVTLAHNAAHDAALAAAAAVRGLADGYSTIIENGKKVAVQQADVATAIKQTGDAAQSAWDYGSDLSDIIVTVGEDAVATEGKIEDLTQAFGRVTVTIQDSTGAFVSSQEAITNVGATALDTSDKIIQLRGSVIDLTNATSNLKDGQLYLNGVLTDEATILNNLAAPEAAQVKLMQDMAAATQSAADAQNNLDSAQSKGSGGKGHGGGYDPSSVIGGAADLVGAGADAAIGGALLQWLTGSNLGNFMGITVGSGTGAGVANPYGTGGSGGQLFDTSVGYTGFTMSDTNRFGVGGLAAGEARARGGHTGAPNFGDTGGSISGAGTPVSATEQAIVNMLGEMTDASTTLSGSFTSADGHVTTFTGNLAAANFALDNANNQYSHLLQQIGDLTATGSTGNLPALQDQLQTVTDTIQAYDTELSNLRGGTANFYGASGPSTNATTNATAGTDFSSMVNAAGISPAAAGDYAVVTIGGQSVLVDRNLANEIAAAAKANANNNTLLDILTTGVVPEDVLSAEGRVGSTTGAVAGTDFNSLANAAGIPQGAQGGYAVVNIGGQSLLVDANLAHQIALAAQVGANNATLMSILTTGQTPADVLHAESAAGLIAGGPNGPGFTNTVNAPYAGPGTGTPNTAFGLGGSPGGGAGLNVVINMNGATVYGQQGADMLANSLTNALRTNAGLKLF